MKKQPTPPTPAELSEQAAELNAVFPRQLCELTIDECETAFRLATGKGKPVFGLNTAYQSLYKLLVISIANPKMTMFLYDEGGVRCVHLASDIDGPVPINAPALTDYLRSIGVDYPTT